MSDSSAEATGVPTADAIHVRDLEIDALRGVAILLVVLGHVMLRFGQSDTSLFTFVVLVNMPLFMLLSGYVTWASMRDTGGFLRRRAWGLLAPYFCWLPLYYLFNRQLAQVDFAQWFLSAVYLPKAPGHLWFLYVLFLCLVLVAVVGRFVKSRARQTVVLVGIAGVLTLVPSRYDAIFGVAQVAWLLPFLVAGTYQLRPSALKPSTRGLVFVVGALVMLAAMALLGRAAIVPGYSPVLGWLDRVGLAPLGSGILVMLRYAAAFAGVSALAVGVSWMPVAFKHSALASLGRRSLGVYAIHPFFIIRLGTGSVGAVVAATVLAIIASLVVVLVLERVPRVAMFLLGRPLPKFAVSGSAAR